MEFSDLNAEIDNILNNALSLISPLTAELAFGGNRATGLHAGTVSSPSIQPTGDTNTGHYFSAADTLNGAAGGVIAYQFGASWLLAAAPEDSRTNTVDVVGEIRSTTSGTPAASIGVGVKFTAESGDENPSDFGEIDFVATDITAASEDTDCVIQLRTGGSALTERHRVASNGIVSYKSQDNTGTPVESTSTLKFFGYNRSMADDGVITLPAVTTNGFGTVVLGGTITARCQFYVDADGDVTLLTSSGTVANADTDTNLCIGTAATQEPLQIKNRLGATHVVNIMFWYD